jgi:uncharacterized protein DUF6941
LRRLASTNFRQDVIAKKVHERGRRALPGKRAMRFLKSTPRATQRHRYSVDFRILQTESILPDLQSCVLCEDVRCEFNGMQTLVGVLNIVPTPKLPVNYMRLCIWTRWCSGAGRFHQRSKIVGPDDTQTIAQAEVTFDLKEMEGHATNVHYFGGVQFQQFGLHHVEIYLGDELKLRFPLPVIQVKQA